MKTKLLIISLVLFLQGCVTAALIATTALTAGNIACDSDIKCKAAKATYLHMKELNGTD